jgi:dTDP-4-amino-4,6-dideoxygalactose transaminase
LCDSDIITPVERKYAGHVHHLYVVKSKDRDALQQHLSQSKIHTQIHYPVPVHKQKAYLDLGYDVYLPVTERVYDEILSLPMHPWLSEKEVLTLANTVRSFYDIQT